MAFYDRFSSLCKERKVSPSAVMLAIGLNKSNATYWKQGSIPKGETLQKLADYFGVSTDYLLGLTPEERETLQYVEDSVVKQTGQSRETVRKALLDEKITAIPYETYNRAIDTADAAVVEKFKGISDSQLRKYMLEDYQCLNRRGRIEATIRMAELADNYRFNQRLEDAEPSQEAGKPRQEAGKTIPREPEGKDTTPPEPPSESPENGG